MTARTDTGALWPNKYKRSHSDPDLQGQINIDGKLVKIVAWYGDNPSLSIRVNNRPTAQQEISSVPNATDKPHNLDEPPKGSDNDIPF